jgi:hypothetical protein
LNPREMIVPQTLIPTTMLFRIQLYLILCLQVAGAYAQQPEFSRHISRSYPVDNTITVDVYNKYGKIHVITWNKDSVKFDIDLRIRAKDKQKLEKMKQELDFDFTQGQSYLKAETKFGDDNSDVFKDLVDIAGSYFSSSNSVLINYTITIPLNASLKVENKFGDVYLDDLNGSVNLNLSYGDLRSGRLNDYAVIKLTSGDGDITFMKTGELFVSYGNMHIKEAGNLTAQTRSSNITIEKSSNLKFDSRRDKLFLNVISSLSGESYFSAVNIGALTDNINFSGRYGDIFVDQIRKSFTLINITSALTDLSLGFEKPLAFRFEMNHPQDMVFVYPDAGSSLTTRLLNAEEKIYLTSGSFGNVTKEPKVVINATRKCTLTIFGK